ncbi:hypothetical protein AB1207_23820 [Kineococcus endophyticus]|uniref:Uncharacterized protein n=1 Tax=Kineococcus endophyticus TaxID=1181883 RepID=A0ABV3PDS2_9ACTN
MAGVTGCGADAPVAAPGPTASTAAMSWTGTHLTGTDRTLTWDVVVPRSAGSPVADELNPRTTASVEYFLDAARATV